MSESLTAETPLSDTDLTDLETMQTSAENNLDTKWRLLRYVASFCLWFSWWILMVPVIIGIASALMPSVVRFAYRGGAALLIWVLDMVLFFV